MTTLDDLAYYDGDVIAGAMRYHQPSCYIIRQIPRRNLKRFTSWQSAADNGFAPCGVCRPGRYPPASPVPAFPNSQEVEETRLLTAADLADLRRRIVQMLVRRDAGMVGVERDTPSARIARMVRDGNLPRVVGPMMRLILEMRNAAEYESKELTQAESDAVTAAWSAIEEWAVSAEVEL